MSTDILASPSTPLDGGDSASLAGVSHRTNGGQRAAYSASESSQNGGPLAPSGGGRSGVKRAHSTTATAADKAATQPKRPQPAGEASSSSKRGTSAAAVTLASTGASAARANASTRTARDTTAFTPAVTPAWANARPVAASADTTRDTGVITVIGAPPGASSDHVVSVDVRSFGLARASEPDGAAAAAEAAHGGGRALALAAAHASHTVTPMRMYASVGGILSHASRTDELMYKSLSTMWALGSTAPLNIVQLLTSAPHPLHAMAVYWRVCASQFDTFQPQFEARSSLASLRYYLARALHLNGLGGVVQHSARAAEGGAAAAAAQPQPQPLLPLLIIGVADSFMGAANFSQWSRVLGLLLPFSRSPLPFFHCARPGFVRTSVNASAATVAASSYSHAHLHMLTLHLLKTLVAVDALHQAVHVAQTAAAPTLAQLKQRVRAGVEARAAELPALLCSPVLPPELNILVHRAAPMPAARAEALRAQLTSFMDAVRARVTPATRDAFVHLFPDWPRMDDAVQRGSVDDTLLSALDDVWTASHLLTPELVLFTVEQLVETLYFVPPPAGSGGSGSGSDSVDAALLGDAHAVAREDAAWLTSCVRECAGAIAESVRKAEATPSRTAARADDASASTGAHAATARTRGGGGGGDGDASDAGEEAAREAERVRHAVRSLQAAYSAAVVDVQRLWLPWRAAHRRCILAWLKRACNERYDATPLFWPDLVRALEEQVALDKLDPASKGVNAVAALTTPTGGSAASKQ